jgi:hypothetical protein
MGLFNRGKSDKNEETVLEHSGNGYLIIGKKAGTPSIGKVCVFFSANAPVAEEQTILRRLVDEQGLASKLADGVIITTAYETIPGIDAFLSSREIPEEMNAFLMSRAMMNDLAKSQAEMGKLAVDPFKVNNVKGVLVQKEL